jgi:hypothetical protein
MADLKAFRAEECARRTWDSMHIRSFEKTEVTSLIYSRVIVHVQISLAILLLLVGRYEAVAQKSATWLINEQQKQIIERLGTVLPRGWTITRTLMNRTPDDWYTLDDRGFEIDGKNGERIFQIWFLPMDWIGIRQAESDRHRLVYWEGVLMGAEYKTVTNTEDVSVHEAVQQMGMNTPSLVNGGWDRAQEVFKDRLVQAERQTQILINHFCKDKICREEAAYSLIVLGVPSKSITLECAEHAKVAAQGFCVSALGHWGGQDSVRVLDDVVSNPETPPQVQKYAAMSLNHIADPSSGPALLRALKTITWPEAEQQTIEALGRIHYELAGPGLLERMKSEPNESSSQAYYAEVLANLRYMPAVPDIEKLCKTKEFSADWILKQQQDGYLYRIPEVALMRLTASWGPPSNGIRLLLLPAGNAKLPELNRSAVVIENVGDRDLNILGTAGAVIVDGKKYENRDSVVEDGIVTLRVNDVAVRAIDLSGLISDDAVHRVEYRLGTAASNQLTMQISPANN